MELWLRIYIYIIIPTNIQSISIAIYATNQLLWTCIVLNSNVKRKDIYGKSISIDLQRYKAAIVFGTINTTSETLLLVTRQYNDVIVVESLHGASKERVTGIVDSKTNTVILTFSGNNSAIIIW